ncbi:MAG: hypothetical protein ACJ72M_08955 [Propionibacteriaceae bacterium]
MLIRLSGARKCGCFTAASDPPALAGALTEFRVWGIRVGEDHRGRAWRSRDSSGTSAPCSPGAGAAGTAVTSPAEVRANRVDRPTALPVSVGAPLADFEAIAERYPVYRIDLRPA